MSHYLYMACMEVPFETFKLHLLYYFSVSTQSYILHKLPLLPLRCNLLQSFTQWHQSTRHNTRKWAFLASSSVLHLKFHPWGLKSELLLHMHRLSLFCVELVWGSVT